MKKTIVSILSVLALVVGCGGTNTLTVTEGKDAIGQEYTTTEYTLTDTGIYHKSIADSTKDKRLLAEKKSQEIRTVDISGQSTDAQALLNQEKIKSIGSIAITPYEGQAPTTGIDVAKEAIGVVPAIVSGTVQGIAVVEAGKTVRSMVEKDTVSVKDSDNTTISTVREDNDQTQVATGTNGVSTSSQTKGSSGSADSGTGSSLNLGEDSSLISSCKDSHAGTTFACVNDSLGEMKYSIEGDEIYKDGVFFTNVSTFESN